MRVMIDTNIFISAVLFPKSKTSSALKKALTSPYQPVTCDYVIDELHRKFREKFPDRISDLNEFLDASLAVIDVVKTPKIAVHDEKLIRDEKDRIRWYPPYKKQLFQFGTVLKCLSDSAAYFIVSMGVRIKGDSFK